MTIKDLAKLTGYSVGTISRVMNDQPNVSPKTREAVLAAVKRYGFQLNATAKILKQQQTNSVLVVVKGMTSELLTGLVRRISNLFADTSYQLDVDFIDEDDNEVLRAVRLCAEKKPRGVLFLGGNPQHFSEHFHDITVPCVLITNSAQDLDIPNLSSVTTDDRRAAEAAVDALLEMGHREIAIIGGDRQVSDMSRRRWEGCRVLRDQGRRVPEDVSVMGFDGLTIGEYLSPKLATITQNLKELADRSVELLRQSMEHSAPAAHLTVPFTVNCKESARSLTDAAHKESERK